MEFEGLIEGLMPKSQNDKESKGTNNISICDVG